MQSLVLLLRLEFGMDLLFKSSTYMEGEGKMVQSFVLYYCCFVWPVSRSVCLATATSTQFFLKKKEQKENFQQSLVLNACALIA